MIFCNQFNRELATGPKVALHLKDNQPKLRDDIELVFTLPPAGDRQEMVRTVDIGHGCIEQRNLTTSEALLGIQRLARSGAGL